MSLREERRIRILKYREREEGPTNQLPWRGHRVDDQLREQTWSAELASYREMSCIHNGLDKANVAGQKDDPNHRNRLEMYEV
jgi:acyl carrier protein phosphodiesterase